MMAEAPILLGIKDKIVALTLGTSYRVLQSFANSKIEIFFLDALITVFVVHRILRL